jgi:hypothetical protein
MAVRRTAWFSPLAKYYSGDELKRRLNVQGMRYLRGRSEMSTVFLWENLKDRGNLEGLSVGGRII